MLLEYFGIITSAFEEMGTRKQVVLAPYSTKTTFYFTHTMLLFLSIYFGLQYVAFSVTRKENFSTVKSNELNSPFYFYGVNIFYFLSFANILLSSLMIYKENVCYRSEIILTVKTIFVFF